MVIRVSYISMILGFLLVSRLDRHILVVTGFLAPARNVQVIHGSTALCFQSSCSYEVPIFLNAIIKEPGIHFSCKVLRGGLSVVFGDSQIIRTIR